MQTESATSIGRIPCRQRHKILCVDDEPHILEGLRLLLARDYEVHTVGEGEAALRTLETAHFPVVICDMRMPGISGAQFMERAASRWPAMVGIILSGASAFSLDGGQEPAPRAFRSLSKPCEPHILRTTVAEALSHHETLVRTFSVKPA